MREHDEARQDEVRQNGGRQVDLSAIRTNQAIIIGLLLLAFIIDSLALAAFVSLVMFLGTAVPRLSLFKQFYVRFLRPSGLIRPDVIVDNPEPHRFAQGFGSLVLAAAVLFLLAGSTLGWLLLWSVIVLAGLNLFLGFCAGCFLYYQLNRLNVPGFERSPIKRGG
ncbi:MAG: DUF4395 domain-containing protein [Candidatus Promineifilaceae bacterium]